MSSKRNFIIFASLTLLIGLSVIALYATHRTATISRHPNSGDKSLEQLFAQAQSLQQSHMAEQATRTVTFLAVGDISLSRNIAQVIKTKQDPLYPFRGIEELLKSTDFNFGNLETPFSNSDAFTPNNTLVFNAPKANVTGLSAYNFAVLNLANNHAFDQGVEGILTTTRVLDTNQLLHMGTGQTLEQAWTPAVIEKNGIKIGFIGASYASSNDGGKTTNTYVARIEDTAHLKNAVQKLKNTVDFIVVTMHAGTEYTPTANAAQVAFAHAAVDAGADIVIGAHPHWVQNKELYCPTSGPSATSGASRSSSSPNIGEARKGIIDSQLPDSTQSNCKWIYYSLGNFIFDQSWSEQTKQGLALKITITKDTIHPAITAPPSNAATLNDLQPAGSMHSAATIIQEVKEIPVYIKDNCCPTETK